MQHNDPPKKPAKGRDPKDFWDNATASLRIMQKTSHDDTSQLYLVAAAVASTVATTAKDYAMSLFARNPPPAVAIAAPVKPKVDVEADSNSINAAFEKIEARIIPLYQEYKKLTQDIKALKNKKKNDLGQAATILIDPALKERQLEILAEIDTLLIDKIKLIPENIREHARRRVDCFFLLSIAVYNKQVVVSKGPTIYQHGVGSKKTGTAACHASLIPNPIVTPLNASPAATATSVMKAATWVYGLFKAPENAAQEPAFTLAGTYLDDLLNQCTELPTVVNDFDGQMEGKFAQSIDVYMAISILNKVAKGELNPIEGLTEFLKYLREFFVEMDRRYFRKEEVVYSNNRMILYPRATKLVWQYEMEGTFEIFNAKKEIADPDYVYMMLGLAALSRIEKANYYLNPFSNTIKARIESMQNEILTSKSNAKNDRPIKREKKPG